MTETRKEIINIISPYMEKDLSEGCLIGIDFYGNKLQFYKISYEQNGVVGFEIDGQIRTELVADIKILGHYDLSAVLKYIVSKGCDVNILVNIYPFKKDDRCGTCDNYKISSEGIIYNKPLHLYTEQEELSLLELLKKLGES